MILDLCSKRSHISNRYKGKSSVSRLCRAALCMRNASNNIGRFWRLGYHEFTRACFNHRWTRGHNLLGRGQGPKKIRGQGQGPTFPRQTLLKSRTGMGEANAKNQGHNFYIYDLQIFHIF